MQLMHNRPIIRANKYTEEHKQDWWCTSCSGIFSLFHMNEKTRGKNSTSEFSSEI